MCMMRKSKKQDKFYNGKYKGHVVKIQVVVNNQGIPMDVQGLYKGVCHDLKIWQSSAPGMKLQGHGC
eukprot:m51a1_g10405 hypothetical protein (67) ;mRNA; f:13528-15230